VPLYLAGARLLELLPMMPTMGNLTLVVAALSYAGQLNLTAVVDGNSCPDVEEFAQGVRRALDDLSRAGSVHATAAHAGGQRPFAPSVGEVAIGGGP
jgi:hypothetical protein